ncbi:MAG TPA: cupin-like domain-containing protein [Gemmataceae bacterium]|jgi:hypothetical protein
MSNEHTGPSLLESTAGSVAASLTGRPVTPQWQRWIAENVLRGNDLQLVADAMLRSGFDEQTVRQEIAAAQEHPYLEAARALASIPATPAATGTVESKIRKRDWVLEIYRRSARQASTFAQVPRVRRPSRQEFLDKYYARNEPVVIEGALDNWPALTRWTPTYFQERFGDRLVEVQAHRHADPDYEINAAQHKKTMRFGDFVAVVESLGPSNDWYITARNGGTNQEQLKELWDDIIQLPEYLRGDDPGNRGFFWYGPRGTVTPLHHDLTNNFMAMVRGRKLVRLIAPYELPDLYNHRHCFSRVDLDRVDYERFPRFRNVTVLDVVLGKGDLFFLPVGWWHYVGGLDVTVTMTFTNFVFDNGFYDSYSTYGEI